MEIKIPIDKKSKEYLIHKKEHRNSGVWMMNCEYCQLEINTDPTYVASAYMMAWGTFSNE